MRHRNAIGWAIPAILGVTATVGLLWLHQPARLKARDLAMTFGGFTNSNGRSVAIFVCTNDTGLRLALNLKAIEYLTDGMWQMATGRAMVAGIPASGIDMPSPNSSTWIVPVHATNIPWRVRFLCVETTTGVKGAIDKASDAVQSIANNGRVGTITTYEGRNYEVVATSEAVK